MVDNKDMGITPAVEISYLTPHEQELLIETMDSEDCTPSLSQAQRMRKMSKEGTLNEDTMLNLMSEQKKPEQKFFSTATADGKMSGVGDTAHNSIPVNYNAIVTPLSEAVTAKTVANVVFIVEWDTAA